jgi:hypothetical protein
MVARNLWIIIPVSPVVIRQPTSYQQLRSIVHERFSIADVTVSMTFLVRFNIIVLTGPEDFFNLRLFKQNLNMAPDQKLRSHPIAGHAIIVKGKLVKVGQLRQEFYCAVDDPPRFIDEVKKAPVKIDILTFLQEFPESKPLYEYYMEWDNVAAIPITTFENWYQREIPKATRRGIRKSQEFCVEVRWVDFDDNLVRGINELFNETPFRQGKPFPHYGKNFATVKKEMALDLERSKFLGAFCGSELIGFIKFIFGPHYARTAVIISKIAHRTKYPTNALIAKAVELCAEQKIPYLVYGKLKYGKLGNQTLVDFKVNNGFRRIEIPRYYVPLTAKGKLGLKLRLQHGTFSLFPRNLLQSALQLRQKWYSLTSKALKRPRSCAIPPT